MNIQSACHIIITLVLLVVRCFGKPFKRDCGQVFHFDFENRMPRGGIWQGREGRVSIYKGKAIFQGAGSLIYPFFSHNDLRGGFAFSFKINPMNREPGMKVAILSNGWEPWTSTLTVFHNETSLGVRVTEANEWGFRDVELVVPQFKMHSVRAILLRQQMAEWNRQFDSSSNVLANSKVRDAPAEWSRNLDSLSKSRDDSDNSNKKALTQTNEIINRLYSGDNIRKENTSKQNGDYSNWDYMKYYASDLGDETSVGGAKTRPSDSGTTNQTAQYSDTTGPQDVIQDTTNRPSSVKDLDQDSSEFIEIRKLYKLDPRLLKDRYKAKMDYLRRMAKSQNNHTAVDTNIQGSHSIGLESRINLLDKNNIDLDEIEVRLSQDGPLIRFQVGMSEIQQTPLAPTEHMKAPRSALRIGSGGGLQPFKGTFDDFVWYTCTPDNFFYEQELGKK